MIKKNKHKEKWIKWTTELTESEPRFSAQDYDLLDKTGKQVKRLTSSQNTN